MNTLYILVLIINSVCMFVSYDAASVSKDEQHLIMRGRVTFLSSFQIPTESGARLTVALQDTSLADAPAKIIARSISKAIRFPIVFAIKYLPSQISERRTYSLSVTIRDKNNELLYINDVNIRVTPVGPRRTKFIDVPVISVKQTKPVVNKNRWPELVGKNGQAAVNIIKKETGKIIQMYIDKFIPKMTLGFTNVVIVKGGAPVTLDYRTDRVRVFVDDKGIVKSVPTIG